MNEKIIELLHEIKRNRRVFEFCAKFFTYLIKREKYLVQSIKVRMRPILQKSTNPISKVTPPLLGSLTLSQLSYFMLRGEKIF